jgi:acetyltransferase-like isoleucine patch superfamily enzyme
MNKIWRLIRFDWPLHFVFLLTNWLPDNIIFLRLRGMMITPFLGSCGKNLRIGRNVTFYNPAGIRIGNNVYIAYGCWFLAGGEINIGNEVLLGPYVVISAGNHTRKNNSYRFGNVEILPVSIGDGTWIGSHVTILGGASLGSGCMVGSNACVVRGNIPDNYFIAGVPAVLKKELADAPE